MEPPAKGFIIITNSDQFIKIHMHSTMHVKITSSNLSIRLRGGGDDNPNTDSKFGDIPYLTNAKFYWDGQPKVDFNERVMYILDNGLASMSIKGGTLLDAVKHQTDPGGLFGVPPRAVAPPSILADNRSRIRKAAACMINYIKPQSGVYKLFLRDYNYEGISMHTFIRNFGPLPIPPKIQMSRENTWQLMTMEVLRINPNADGLFKWADIVEEMGRILNKDGNSRKNKFVEGLPAFFQAEKTAMRHDVTIQVTFPALYGTMPQFIGSPLALVPHPLAGQPNIMAMARKYFPDWTVKAAAAGKDIPNGLVRAVEDCETPEDVSMLMADIKEDMKCHTCGGHGHTSRFTNPNGEEVVCPTKLIKAGQFPSSSKSDKFQRKFTKQAQEIELLTEELNQLRTDTETSFKLRDTANRSARRRPTPKPVHQISDGDTEGTQDEENSEIDEDANSVDSHASSIGGFADALQQKRRLKRN